MGNRQKRLSFQNRAKSLHLFFVLALHRFDRPIVAGDPVWYCLYDATDRLYTCFILHRSLRVTFAMQRFSFAIAMLRLIVASYFCLATVQFRHRNASLSLNHATVHITIINTQRFVFGHGHSMEKWHIPRTKRRGLCAATSAYSTARHPREHQLASYHVRLLPRPKKAAPGQHAGMPSWLG